MGSCSSNELTWSVNESIQGQGQRTVNIAKSLGINDKDLNKLFKAFVSLDKSRLKTGHKQQEKEDMEEYLRTEGITTKEMAHHLAKTFYSQSGIIYFEEFVITSWWIVSLNEEEVAKWIFRLFCSEDDEDKDTMTPAEMRKLVETIGSHHPNSKRGLEDCYKHLCFEKIEQHQKSKGPHYHGKAMEPQQPSGIINSIYINQEKLFVTLGDWTSEISKKRTVLSPIYKMQAILREKTVGSRSFEWRTFRQKTFGSNLTLDEIKACLDINTTYKPTPMVHPVKATGRVFAGTEKDSVGHVHHSTGSFVEVQDHDHVTLFAGKPHRLVDKQQITPRSNHENNGHSSASLHASSSHHASNHTPRLTPRMTPRGSMMESNRRTSISLHQQSNHSVSNHNHTPRSIHEKDHQPTTASYNYSNRDSLRNHTPRINPRSDKDRPISASSNHSHHSHHSHHTPRSNEDKERPISASSNHSHHSTHSRSSTRSNRKNERATFPAPYQEKDYDKIIDQLEGKEWGEVMTKATR